MQAAGGSSGLVLGGNGPDAGAPSSNRFANGNNQNAGNVITDRPSTRVHYGPGGKTSICLGQDMPEAPVRQRHAAVAPKETTPAPADPPALAQQNSAPAAAKAVSSNAFANGANQNAGNFITDRPSTRVHCGPGGATSICLGSDVAPVAPATRAEPSRGIAAPAPAAEPPRPATTAQPAAQPVGGGARTGVSSNCFANGANQNAGNCITDRPSTRVMYGPGGATSICLGVGGDEPKKAAAPKSVSAENTNTANLPAAAPAAKPAVASHRGRVTSSQIVLG